jgi:hypothetical protein
LEDQIIIKTEVSEERTDYSPIEHVFTGRFAVYLYKSFMTAHIIPNHAFADDGEKQRFVDFVKSKIVNEKRQIQIQVEDDSEDEFK